MLGSCWQVVLTPLDGSELLLPAHLPGFLIGIAPGLLLTCFFSRIIMHTKICHEAPLDSMSSTEDVRHRGEQPV